MVIFTAIELDEHSGSVAFIINEAQEVERLDEAAELLQGASETGWSVIGLQGPGKARSLDDADLERAGEPQWIVENAVIGFSIDTPKPCPADMRDRGGELVGDVSVVLPEFGKIAIVV